MVIKNYKLFLESMSSDISSQIPKSIFDLNFMFKESGKELYLVGGSVRDYLIGKKIKDFDLTTNATPDEILQIVGDKYKTNLLGESFGVIVVYTPDQPEGIEIATFRSDIYDGKLGQTRNPDIQFSTIDEDVKRRDLSINGLFYDIENKKIIDLVGGIDDIKNKIVRMIGDPDLRIKEDPLRILRCIRFAYRYDFEIHDETSESIKNNKTSLNIITRERIWDEIKKAHSYDKDFINYLNLISELKVWSNIFLGSTVNEKHLKTNTIEIIVANLFRDENTNSLESKLVQSYKIPLDLTRKSIFLINFLNFKPEDVFDIYKKKIQCGIDDVVINEWLKLNNINDKWYQKFLRYKPSISSTDLMNKGFKGSELGKEIKRLEIEKFKE
jgi:tRNA nucleotidyltransferase/poly(A) polymerase